MGVFPNFTKLIFKMWKIEMQKKLWPTVFSFTEKTSQQMFLLKFFGMAFLENTSGWLKYGSANSRILSCIAQWNARSFIKFMDWSLCQYNWINATRKGNELMQQERELTSASNWYLYLELSSLLDSHMSKIFWLIIFATVD